jgi:serine protease Do
MISATYIGGSMTYDIAVLEVKGSEVLKNSNAKAVEIADSNYLKVGSTAIAVGNPDAGGISATVGVISVDSEYITMLAADEASTISFRSIRVDAAVNPGNSGGGLFNAKGQLIGIVNAKTVKEDIENMGYAIPSTLAVYVAENIIWNASNGNTGVLKGLMGVEVTTKESKAVYNEELQMVEIVETVSVNKITPGSLASKFMQEGDIFVSVSSRDKEIKCTRMFMVVDFMLSVRPGDQITVTFIRNGVEMQKTVTIAREYFTSIV